MMFMTFMLDGLPFELASHKVTCIVMVIVRRVGITVDAKAIVVFFLIGIIVTVYTDGACLYNGMANAQSGARVWFGPNHAKNQAIKIPGTRQSNQVGEVVVIIAALTAVPLNQPLKIVTDSKYAIDGLTTHLGRW